VPSRLARIEGERTDTSDESAGGIAAVILAAGTSSRMGTSKPLLPLGTASVIGRVIETVRQAGVSDLVVVTGHRAAEVAPVIERLGVRHVHNPGYETGMFSSVRTGVAALRDDVEAFFILPVDCALVRPEVLRLLMRSHAGAPDAILHPTCCGLRGHPPLISGRHREQLARAGAADDLRSFLERHRDAELHVDVQDLTILMDMDTPEDYERLRRFAEIMDSATTPETVALPALGADDALYLLGLLNLPDRVVRHGRTVAAVGVALAEALKPTVAELDVDLVQSGGLLHDMAKAARKHAAVGQALLENLGLHRLGSLVGSHMLMPPEQLDAPLPTEEQLVYLADKLVVGDQVKSLDERAARTLQKHAGDAAVALGVEARLRASRIIAQRVGAIAGRSLEEIVGPVRRGGALDA
jgi:molybdenum cofactor cytidylyltransferase